MEACEAYGDARARGSPAAIQKARRRMLMFRVLKHFTPSLVSPRVYYTQRDFPEVSFWAHIRENKRQEAIFKFLGVPFFLLLDISARARPYLVRYDRAVPQRGQPPVFDYVDAIALVLRRYQIMHHRLLQQLEIEFGRTDSVIGRVLNDAVPVFQRVLKGCVRLAQRSRVHCFLAPAPITHTPIRSMRLADIRYPSMDEAANAFKGIVEQFGLPPWWQACKDLPVLAIDGTVTPVYKPSTAEGQLRIHGLKGDTFNNILVASADGTIADATLGVDGRVTDARAARVLIERHADPVVNPDKLGLLLDCGFTAHSIYKRTPGKPLRMRPLMIGDAMAEDLELRAYQLRSSAYATVLRQHNEMANNTIQKAFPFWLKKRHLSDHDAVVADLFTILRLNNLRARAVGWNQVRTMFLRHADENFREQLRLCTARKLITMQRKVYKRLRKLRFA